MFRTLRHILFPVFNALGALLAMLAMTMLLPIAIALREGENTLEGFLLSMGITLTASGIFYFSTRRNRRELEARDGFLLVTMAWLGAVGFGTLPFFFLLPEISLHRIVFETVSCLTTTGATALIHLEDLPLSLNYWRCLLSWLGGMGIIVLAVAILPLLGVGGAQVFKAENSNLFKDSKLTPRIADTAKALYFIYAIFSLLCVLGYRWAGMSWDDAILFMFTTVSLSGIAPYDASIGYFNSMPIELVSILFIFLSGFNFLLHFTAWRQRSILAYFKDPEALAWLFIILGSTAFVTYWLYLNHTYDSWETCLRFAAFHVASVLSTTGYSSADYSQWPSCLGFLLLIGGVFASCAGSTGGGVKMIRVLILIKQSFLTLEKLIRPRAYLPLRLGDREIPESLVINVFSFITLHLVLVTVCSFIIVMSGVDLVTATSSVLACIANIGPGLGQVGPANNFAWCSPIHLWIGSFCMFVGRLELFTIFVLFSRSFWRI